MAGVAEIRGFLQSHFLQMVIQVYIFASVVLRQIFQGLGVYVGALPGDGAEDDPDIFLPAQPDDLIQNQQCFVPQRSSTGVTKSAGE